MTENKDADAERVSDIVARLRRGERFYVSAAGPVYSGPTELHTAAADIIEAQSKALAEALPDAVVIVAVDKGGERPPLFCTGPCTREIAGRVIDGWQAQMSKSGWDVRQYSLVPLTPTPENPNG